MLHHTSPNPNSSHHFPPQPTTLNTSPYTTPRHFHTIAHHITITCHTSSFSPYPTIVYYTLTALYYAQLHFTTLSYTTLHPNTPYHPPLLPTTCDKIHKSVCSSYTFSQSNNKLNISTNLVQTISGRKMLDTIIKVLWGGKQTLQAQHEIFSDFIQY